MSSGGEHITGLGTRADSVATVPGVRPESLSLSTEEWTVLAQVGRLARISDVLARSPFAEAQTLALLLSLRAKGAIAPAHAAASPAPVPPVSAALQEEVDLEPERRADLLALEARLETEDFFALLGVPPGAEPAAVKAAFYELSKRYHPDRFYGRNLGSFRPRLERIFRRLNEAHTTLTEPERRRAYLVAHPQLARTPTPVRPAPSPEERLEAALTGGDEARDSERRARLARHPYLLRTGRLRDALVRGREQLARGEYEAAVNELGRAQQLEPGNREVAGLLGEARRRAEEQRAERELARGRQALAQGDAAGALAAFRLAATQAPQNAEAAWQVARLLKEQGAEAREVRTWAQRAVDLAPRHAAARFLLGVVLLEAGAKKVAKMHFESVLELEPGHPGAREKLKGLRWVF